MDVPMISPWSMHIVLRAAGPRPVRRWGPRRRGLLLAASARRGGQPPGRGLDQRPLGAGLGRFCPGSGHGRTGAAGVRLRLAAIGLAPGDDVTGAVVAVGAYCTSEARDRRARAGGRWPQVSAHSWQSPALTQPPRGRHMGGPPAPRTREGAL
eukprot:scaffold1939_cov392-Prasinococcus_capsulatus_cf.AAC.11